MAMLSYQTALRCFRRRSFRIPSGYYCSTCQMASKAVEVNRELFEYTSGRWIYNESLRLLEKSLVFSVQELKRIAAASIHRHEADIKSVRKLAEGGFNRVFEITMKDDNTQILARIPYPSTVPKRLVVASEVATLDLIRSHDIPVPKVLDYSTDPDNPIGAEYIIMEKVHGNPIGDSWYTFSDKQRLKVLMGLVQLEAKLFAIDLPASGSLYYSHDLPPETKGAAIRPSHTDATASRGEICVGPIASLKWWYKKRSSLPNISRGPHFDATESLTAVAEKELSWLKSYGKPRFPFERAYREATNYQKSTPEEYIATLEKYLKIAPYLVPKDKSLHRPTLRHPDLQPNNIFVSEDLDIVGLIDWQYCSALPLFLAAGIPQYIQNYDDEESLRFVPPKLPETLNEMSADERSATLEQFRRRHLHFYYLGFTQRFNASHFHALDYDGSRRLKGRTFDHAGNPWEGNNIHLKADLVNLVQNWDNIAMGADAESGTGAEAPPCPVTFGQSEAQETLQLEKEYDEMDSHLSVIRDAIGISVDGWTSNEMFEDAVARAKEFKKRTIESVSDNKFDQEMTEKHWPFDDFAEDD